MPRGPFSGRKTSIADAQEQGGRDKYQPGSYYSRVTRGVYKESDQVAGAEYFGVETIVVVTTAANSSEENRPYERSQRANEAASWVFNLNPPNRSHQYLADGNVKNLAQALMDTMGFAERLTEEEDACLGMLLDAYEEGRKLTSEEMEQAETDSNKPDPWAYVSNLLVADEGERFAGLPLRIVARDARNKKNTDARPFVACNCYGVDEDELEEHFGGHIPSPKSGDESAA